MIPRMSRTPLDVSVLLPFRDDEDIVGTACKRIAAHLTNLGLSFEILAIEEDSGDNSHALLAMLRREIPTLQVLYAESADRGYTTGASKACGRTLWLVPPAVALAPLAPFNRAFRKVSDGKVDATVVDGRFAVCHRTRNLDALAGFRGRDVAALRRRLARRGSRIERWLPSSDRPLSRLIHALTQS